jgi:nitrite reductase (NO-forming)
MTDAQTTRANRVSQAVIGLLVLVVVTLGAALAAAKPAAPAAPPAASGNPSVPTEVTVKVVGMSFVPDRIEVPAGGTLVIRFENTGDQLHDLVLATGVETGKVSPGDTATLDAGVIANAVEGWCSLAGHRAMGMTLDIVAVGASHSVDASPDPVRASAPTMADLMAQAEKSPALPAELPPLTNETHHEVTLMATEASEEIADGVTRSVWTYNGTTPGPTLHGRIGDTFTITLVNAGTMGHSIDFHAGELAPDGPMRTIAPGESLVYEFTAMRAGIWMYHCGTMPMATHIANGMFGAVVIEPDGLEPARSFVLIQSEVYREGAEAGAAADAVAFNGRAFQYVTHPLTARAGERVRMWVLDAGPDSSLAFHVVGTQFDTVWTEGAYTVHQEPGSGAQVLPLLAAQGGFVEFVPPQPGHYAIVNHQMSDAEKGAKGVLEVTE